MEEDLVILNTVDMIGEAQKLNIIIMLNGL